MSGVLSGVCVIRVGWEVSGGRGLGKWIWSLWALLARGHVLSAKPLLSEPLQSAALLPHLDPSALDSTRLLHLPLLLLFTAPQPRFPTKPFCLELSVSMGMVSEVVQMELISPLPRLHNTSRLFP